MFTSIAQNLAVWSVFASMAAGQGVTKDSILGYDPDVTLQPSSNVGLSPEDLERLKNGVQEQLLDYIPSAAVFRQIGGYMKPNPGALDELPELFVEVPRVRLEMIPTQAETEQRLEIEMFNEYHSFGQVVGYDTLHNRMNPQYGPHSDRYLAFLSRCQATPPPTDFSSRNLQVNYQCRVSLPQINIRRQGKAPVYVDRSSGAYTVYTDKARAEVLSVKGRMVATNVAPLSPKSEGIRERYDHRFYSCTFVADIKLGLASLGHKEIHRCLDAAMDGDNITAPGEGAEDALQTPVQHLVDRAILGLVKPPVPSPVSDRPVYVAPHPQHRPVRN